jgi:hypothetical protein
MCQRKSEFAKINEIRNYLNLRFERLNVKVKGKK